MSKRNRRNRNVSTTLVDVVIPVHGRFDLLERCVNSIPEAFNGIANRIIAVDNASPDKQEAQNFYNRHPEILLVQNKQNYGFPVACNLGVKRGFSPLIFFLNSDVILDPGSLDQLIRSLDDPKVGIAGMFLTFPEDYEKVGLNFNMSFRPKGKVQHVGIETNIRGQPIHMYIGWSADNPKVLARKESYMVTGAALLTRRDLYVKTKGFDIAYGRGTYEDVDYCMKVRQLGYNIEVNVAAHAVHYTGATVESYRLGYALTENQALFMSRWANKLVYTEYKYW